MCQENLTELRRLNETFGYFLKIKLTNNGKLRADLLMTTSKTTNDLVFGRNLEEIVF